MLVERKDLQIVQLGTVTLKGKTEETEIASITQLQVVIPGHKKAVPLT